MRKNTTAPAALSAESELPSLVAGLKCKSAEAFQAMVDRYSSRLFAMTYRILGNPQDAEDCLQDTYLQVLLSIRGFEERSCFFTWLYRIAANKALMKVRRRRVRKAVPLESQLPRFEVGLHVEEVRDWSQWPDHILYSRELGWFLEKTIRELPDGFRIPLVLKDVEQLSIAETSEMMGLPASTIKNRLHRARLIVRGKISGHLLGRKYFSLKAARGTTAFPAAEKPLQAAAAGELEETK